MLTVKCSQTKAKLNKFEDAHRIPNSRNFLNVDFAESSVEIDYQADHIKAPSGFASPLTPRQQLEKLDPDKWNNIPYPLVDCIKLLLKELKSREKQFNEHVERFEEHVTKNDFQRSRLVRNLQIVYFNQNKCRKKKSIEEIMYLIISLQDKKRIS